MFVLYEDEENANTLSDLVIWIKHKVSYGDLHRIYELDDVTPLLQMRVD